MLLLLACIAAAAERRSRSATQQRPGGNLQPRSLPGLNAGPGQKKEIPARNVNIKLPAMIPSQKPVQLRQKDKLVLLPRSASSSDAGEAAAAAAVSSQEGAAAAAAARTALAQAAAAVAEGDAVLDMSSMGQPAHLFEDLAQQVRQSTGTCCTHLDLYSMVAELYQVASRCCCAARCS
jgi:hypothetical protein